MAETPENQETSEEQGPAEEQGSAEEQETVEEQEAPAQNEVTPEATPEEATAQNEVTPEEAPAEDEGAPAAESAEAEDSAPVPTEEEASEAGSDTREESAEAPVAEQDEAEPAEEPRVEQKKRDAIPGADLEPIAVEPEEKPLSAEERARREAEEEERARREAALSGESEEEESHAAKRAPAKMESDSRYLATGKRKRSIARVTLLPGSGKIEINRRPLDEFFPRPLHQTMARQPLATTGYEGSVDVRVRVHGGGISGQAGAVRHGIARALTEIDPELRGELKRRGFLTRDARVKERRKAGLKKARKRPQFSKR